MWLLPFCFLVVVARAQVPMLFTDYSGGPTQGDAWITLTTPSRDWELQRLVWCKSLVPNDQNPAPLPHDCVGRNLMRIQLYPGGNAVVTEPPETSAPDTPTEGEAGHTAKGNTYYVDPQRVGGWDSRHQWIMEMELQRRHETGKTPATMIEVVRFNPLSPLLALPPSTTQGQESTSAAAAITSSQVGTTDSSSSSSSTETSTAAISGTATAPVQRSWMGFAVILLSGFCAIGGGVLLYRVWKYKKPQHAYGRTGVLQYDWNGGGATSDEDTRLREEDLQILSKMNN